MPARMPARMMNPLLLLMMMMMMIDAGEMMAMKTFLSIDVPMSAAVHVDQQT
jgi:hypothetical protein